MVVREGVSCSDFARSGAFLGGLAVGWERLWGWPWRIAVGVSFSRDVEKFHLRKVFFYATSTILDVAVAGRCRGSTRTEVEAMWCPPAARRDGLRRPGQICAKRVVL